ncbi:MAG: peptide chain release factor N(5)-glutamine methyltransferase [Patescibacteria group bacterium]|nr:peptide chain release factor N(5)-glutamine methyltransferase [Patescibacteria group bacterium]
MKKTNRQALTEAITKLKKTNIPTPQLDAELLLANVLRKSREFVISYPKKRLNEKQIHDFESMIIRRTNDEPLAYLTGEKEFYGLSFLVDKNTLIPRPETELIVDKALDMLRSMLRNKIIVVDVGTGSGNIIISVAKKLLQTISGENTDLFAIDPSIKVLKVAQNNAKKHGVSENIKFLNGRFLNPLVNNPLFDIRDSSILILANLPYLSKDIYNTSPNCVKIFEPENALLSGQVGLDHYRKLLNQIKLLTIEQGISATTLIEISPEQKSLIIQEIKSLLPSAKIEFKKDLAEKWRLVIITMK